MVQHFGVNISIETSDGPLLEHAYPDVEPTPQTKTVYIELPSSEEPLPFMIRISPVTPLEDDPTLVGFQIVFTMDGIRDALANIITLENDPTGKLYTGLYINTPDQSSVVLKEMLFGKINTTEEDGDEAGQDAQNIGLISIRIRRIISVNSVVSHQPPLLLPQDAPHEGAMSEKKLKGSSSTHQVKLGKDLSDVVMLRKGPRKEYKYSPLVGNVRFLYRSKASLQSLGVIPHDPPPPRQKREREEDVDLTGSDERLGNGIKREPGIKKKRVVRRKRF